jgi:hypothetical protein
MAINKYFVNYNSKYEQNLLEDLVVETIKIHGLDMYYIPRELVDRENIFGDDPISNFRQHFIIEMYIQSVDGFEGDGDIIGKFGLEIRDSATLIVSKKRFQNVTDKFRPLEGDLIYFPLSKKFFEIKFVEHENPFYQLGKNYVYSLSVELFQFSEEEIFTQIEEIDSAIDKQEYSLSLTLSSVFGSSSNEFAKGDTVYQYHDGTTNGSLTGANATGVVFSYESPTLTLQNITGVWKKSVTGSTYYAIKSDGLYYGVVGSKVDSVEESEFNDNEFISDTSDNFLDFSENNPFGDIF